MSADPYTALITANASWQSSLAPSLVWTRTLYVLTVPRATPNSSAILPSR